ncbi:MAG TPA: cysteine--tRNA ligase [Clostridiales bacterium]|nr:cysteine--tRNA ligase [Clostridiales bacterium]
MKLYNTLTRRKEVFEPIQKDAVRMYSCGPTVYSYAHIGNLRAYIFMDTLRRVLKYNGYKIDGVMNITDVGHLTSDADSGEDKMEKASKKENKSPFEIADFYTKWFLEDCKKLNIDLPEKLAKATDHIQDMINFVEGLVKNDMAYVVDGNVYFDVKKLKNYGRLSGINLDDLKAGARIAVNEQKRSPYDFALWIKAPENHIMKWQSPWGLGYPGWHIECSAMSRKYLGDTFDIHTGGVDHIPVHHENELAQSEGLTGKLQAKFWMHVEFLQVDGGKMSKSLGNCYRIEELEEKGFSALDYRYFCLNGHYRKKLNFTFEALEASKVARNRLMYLLSLHKNGNHDVDKAKLEKFKHNFEDAVNDDLNIPFALGELWTMLREMPYSKDVYNLAISMDEIFGLSFENCELTTEKNELEKFEVPEEVLKLAEERKQAKIQKNFALADSIRAKVESLGYMIIDGRQGTEIKKK